jgi:hypothetical protein
LFIQGVLLGQGLHHVQFVAVKTVDLSQARTLRLLFLIVKRSQALYHSLVLHFVDKRT